jgi:hypothetical protein
VGPQPPLPPASSITTPVPSRLGGAAAASTTSALSGGLSDSAGSTCSSPRSRSADLPSSSAMTPSPRSACGPEVASAGPGSSWTPSPRSAGGLPASAACGQLLRQQQVNFSRSSSFVGRSSSCNYWSSTDTSPGHPPPSIDPL